MDSQSERADTDRLLPVGKKGTALVDNRKFDKKQEDRCRWTGLMLSVGMDRMHAVRHEKAINMKSFSVDR